MGMRLLALNGAEVWGYVVELGDGLRVRFDINDWQRLGLGTGRRVPVRVPGRGGRVALRHRGNGVAAGRVGADGDAGAGGGVTTRGLAVE